MGLFYELAYSFNHDNPFAKDTGKQKLTTLKQNIQDNMSINFSEIENNIKFYELKPSIVQLYGDKTKRKLIYETSMINDFKDVVLNFPQFRSFNSWLDNYDYVGQSQSITGGTATEEPVAEEEEAEEVEETVEDKPLIDDTQWDSIIPINPNKFDYKKTGGLTNYNITSDKPISYDEIRKLTVNIARSKLKVTVEKSEQVLALEKKKRKELLNNIQKYKNIKAIGILVEDNIQDMDLQQLEHTLAHCEKLFQSQKLKETIKRGTNFGGLIFDTVFPEGIKIGKTKRLKIKGMGKTIIDSVFDSQSTIGVAFQNIVDKHNWNITDEAVLMLSIGEMFISNLKVENVEEEKPKQETNNKSNMTSSLSQPMLQSNIKHEQEPEEENEDIDEEEEVYEYYSEN